MTGTVEAGDRPADTARGAHGVTLPSMFAATVDRLPDAVAVRSGVEPGAGALTWQQYREQVARAVTGLSHLGLSHGDRVVMMTTNRPEFHVADIAVAHLGGVAVSVYNSSAPEQIRYVVEHCGGRGLIIEERFADRVLEAIRDVPTVAWLVVIGDKVPTGATPWVDVLAAEPADLDAVARSVSPDDLATVIYTSGATGPPKGVMLTHACIAWQTTAMLARIDQPTDGWRAISYLPMAHIGERMMGHYLAIRGAMQVTCCTDPAGVHPFLEAVRPQIFLGMPRTWEKLHAELASVIDAMPAAERREVELALDTPADRGSVDEHAAVLTSLRRQVGLEDGRVMLTGGGVLGGETQAFFRRLRLPLSDIYGMSESTGPISWSPYDSPPGRVGRPMPGCDVRIDVDGEVLFRSRTAFAGYLNNDPLPGSLTDWYSRAPVHRLNVFTPYSLVGELGNYGLTALIGYSLATGMVLGYADRRVRQLAWPQGVISGLSRWSEWGCCSRSRPSNTTGVQLVASCTTSWSSTLQREWRGTRRFSARYALPRPRGVSVLARTPSSRASFACVEVHWEVTPLRPGTDDPLSYANAIPPRGRLHGPSRAFPLRARSGSWSRNLRRSLVAFGQFCLTVP